MDGKAPNRAIAGPADILPPDARDAAAPARLPALSTAGEAALAAARALAKQATAPATLRAYQADWTHFSRWCAEHGFIPVPAAPAIVGAYLASLADSHAPTTIRRRLSALGKMHRFNDLAWNPAHRAIQGPLQQLRRERVGKSGHCYADAHDGAQHAAGGFFPLPVRTRHGAGLEAASRGGYRAEIAIEHVGRNDGTPSSSGCTARKSSVWRRG
jgi:hypothetical protein